MGDPTATAAVPDRPGPASTVAAAPREGTAPEAVAPPPPAADLVEAEPSVASPRAGRRSSPREASPTTHRVTTPPETARPEPAPPIAEAADTSPACVTIGGGVRVVFPDGRTIEGPRRTPCVALSPGRHALRVEDPSTHEVLWERVVDIRPGDSRAITASGVR
jgi:hypothetical protein